MASNTEMAAISFDLKPALKPWERFDWSPEQQQRIYRDWGVYLMHKKLQNRAKLCYNKSLELNPRDFKALYMRSFCKRKLADIQAALEDALAAEKIYSNNPSVNLSICDALYELNRFEDTKVELFLNVNKYDSAVKREFMKRLIVVGENLSDCVGRSLDRFLLTKGKYISNLVESNKRRSSIDRTPLWKKLRNQEKCDVMSVLAEEEELESPLKVKRRERWFRIFNQIYFGRNWRDVLFMRNLLLESDEVLSPNTRSRPEMLNLFQQNYGIVKKFVKMLHTRSPLYNEYEQKFKDERFMKIQQRNYLYCKQFQTRRNMFTILRLIRYYRSKGYIEKMSRYIESVMGDYVVAKTDRLMPWKFEFMNEVYNTLALALMERYHIPDSFRSVTRNKMEILLGLPIENNERQSMFRFASNVPLRSQLQNDNVTQAKYEAYLARLRKRQVFAKYSIEKCYLWYEIARSHFKNGRYEHCILDAKHLIEETKHCNHIVWNFLGVMLIVRSHGSLRRIEYCRNSLKEAIAIASLLDNPKLTEFVELVFNINEAEMSMKRKTYSGESIRKRRTSSTSRLQSGSESEADS